MRTLQGPQLLQFDIPSYQDHHHVLEEELCIQIGFNHGIAAVPDPRPIRFSPPL